MKPRTSAADHMLTTRGWVAERCITLRDLAESRGDWRSAAELCELSDWIGVGLLRLATVAARVERTPL
jgi:hypothetical protein